MDLTSSEMFSKLDISENCSLEFKRAGGRDGKGEIPASLFETYSAMANTDGGTIFLGVEEKNKAFRITGVQNVDSLQKTLWDILNNKQKVSSNLLSNEDVAVIEIQGFKLISISVPRAPRARRPIYINGNPITGTFRRNHEGDYLCEEETVRRMMAEQVEQSRDGDLLAGYTIEDIAAETLRAYKQIFTSAKPDHPFSSQPDTEFLRSIGGWTTDRKTGTEGLTKAGLLMFGRMSSILEVFPNYVVDYREISDPTSGLRWTDRITTDGTWTGNLFDFYRQVIGKLVSGLKIPFKLRKNEREDSTPLHEALREALINTLIHSDYTERVSVLVEKRHGLFSFRNPGTMRLSVETAIRGGQSDCRNRKLQKMFQLVGLAEQAGSGIPKIWKSWDSQHFRKPNLRDQIDPDQTILSLRTVSLLPDDAMEELDKRFGTNWRNLSETQRLALVTVCVEGQVDHSRLKSITSEHSRDVTIALASLVREGFLDSKGMAKNTYYCFVGTNPQMKLFDCLEGSSSEQIRASSVQIDENSVQIDESSVQMGIQDAEEDFNLTKYPLAWAMRNKSKISRQAAKAAILEVCREGYVTLRMLAAMLNRKSETLRIHYLNEMIKSGDLVYKHPDSPHHPNQAYKAAS